MSRVVAQADGAPAKVGFEIETRFCRGAKGCFEIETGPSRVILFSEFLRENIVMVQYSPFVC